MCGWIYIISISQKSNMGVSVNICTIYGKLGESGSRKSFGRQSLFLRLIQGNTSDYSSQAASNRYSGPPPARNSPQFSHSDSKASSQYSSQQNIHSPQQSFSSQSSGGGGGGGTPQSPYSPQVNYPPPQSQQPPPVDKIPDMRATPSIINVTLNKRGGGMGLSIVAARVSCTLYNLQ